MKKVFLGMALVIMTGCFSSCGSKAAGETGDSDSVATETVAESFEGEAASTQDAGLIMASVQSIYRMMPPDWATPELKKAIEDADAKAAKDGSEMGFFDYDLLTNSQDPGEFKDVEIVSIKGNDTAVVKVFGEAYGNDGYVVATLRLIDDQYYIDDIEGPDGKSVKKTAMEYISRK